MASLSVVAGGTIGERFKLENKDEFLIGRWEHSDVRIDAMHVSVRHAKIVSENGRFYLVDLWSKNHTYLNKERLPPDEPRLLNDDDRIRVCDVQFRFHAESTSIQFGDEDSSSTVQASIGVASQQQFLETQPIEKLHSLLKFGNGLLKTLEEGLVSLRIADTLLEVFKKADRCFVLLRDDSTGELYRAAVRNRPAVSEPPFPFSSTIVR